MDGAARDLTAPVFDVKELSVYDGPGMRVTVFLKGCPMRCLWCHNPEGLSPSPQVMVDRSSCLRCGRCDHVDGCALRESGRCSGCGRCVAVCPAGCRRISGEPVRSSEMAGRIVRLSDMFAPDDGCGMRYPDAAPDFGGGRRFWGGVTFSGGEPTSHIDWLEDVSRRLREHMETGGFFSIAAETSGCCGAGAFGRLLSCADLVYFDVKHTDPEIHKRLTGRSSGPIMENLRLLAESRIPFVVRHTLIPGVNDGDGELESFASLLASLEAPSLIRAELLPYNPAAGAKYKMALMDYSPVWDEKRKPNANVEPFARRGIEAVVL